MSSKTKTVLPKIRFPEFKDAPEWGVKPLHKLAKRMNKKNKDDALKRVLTNSAIDGVVDQSDYFDKDIANKKNLSGYFIVDEGDYVYNPRISNVAPVGPISKNKIGKGIMSPLYTVFRFNKKDNEFFEQYFNATQWHYYLKKISNNGARHDRISITNDEFMEMPLPDPEPQEQKKIADFLDSADELIEAEEKKLSALQDHKIGLLQQLFPVQGEALPILRFNDFHDDPEWDIEPLDVVCDILNNRRKPISSENREKGIYPYYGASGIVDYINDYEFNERLILIGEDGAKWRAFEKTAFLADGKYWVNNHAHVLKPKKINDVFLENYLVRLDISNFVSGYAPPKLTLGKLKEIPIPYPKNPNEQKIIADCFSYIDGIIYTQSKRIETLLDHKKGLMQQLFPSAEELVE